MTKPATQGVGIAALDDATVAEYLEAVPDFFERQPQLVQRLRLSDARSGGGTVSLIERQVELLRERNRKLEQRLVEFVENGRANDELAERIHRLCVRLVHSRGLQTAVDALEASLREDFDVKRAVLVLLRPGDAAESAFLRVARPDAPELRGFEALFNSGRPRCGQVRDSQREWLFGDGAAAVASVALVPLGPGGRLGLLALGADDAHRFNPTMSTDFLARIGELVSAAIAAG